MNHENDTSHRRWTLYSHWNISIHVIDVIDNINLNFVHMQMQPLYT